MIDKAFIDLGCEVVKLNIDKEEPEWILITVCSEAANEVYDDCVAEKILIAELELIELSEVENV